MTRETLRTLAGRYDLLAQVGAGGGGAVFRAHDRVLDRTVAVKLLRPGQDENARARLRAEARIVAGLSHPGIAHIHDYGEETAGGETSSYVVMQYVEGRTLRDVLLRGPLPAARVAALVAEIADALAAAHTAGVVHRDVKPANIMLGPGGRAILLDFGIARHADLEPLTLTGTVVGTVDYISPEQAAGRGATGRSDLYALGMVAHEALTGRRALTRDSQVATLLAHVNEDVPPLPPSVPAGLRRLVAELVQRDPAKRPADATVTARRADELARTMSASDVTAPDMTAPDMTAPPDATAPLTMPMPAGPVAPPPTVAHDLATPTSSTRVLASGTSPLMTGDRRRRWLVLGAAAAVILLLLLILLVRCGGDESQSPQESSPSLGTSPTSTPSATVRVRASAYVGRPYAEVARRLRSLGLTPRRVDVTRPDDDPGTAVSLAPTGVVRRGSGITVDVAVAPASSSPAPPAKGSGHGKPKGKAEGKPKGKAHGGKHPKK